MSFLYNSTLPSFLIKICYHIFKEKEIFFIAEYLGLKLSCRLNGQCCLIKAWFLIQTFILYCLYCLLQIIYMWLLTANTAIKTFILWPIISGICSVKQRSISKEFLKKIYCQPSKTQISYFSYFRISAKLSIHGKFSDFFLRLFKNVRVIFLNKMCYSEIYPLP